MRRRGQPGAAVPRFDTVDVLRGLSVLAVVLLHCSIFFGGQGVRLGASLPRWLRSPLFFNGGNGVTVFFAVSGFLITLTSLRRFGSLGAMRPGLFYRIRFARIAPMLLLLLTVLSVLHLLHVPEFHIRSTVASLPRALFAALTFHLNWLEAQRGFLPPNWDVLWSLSIEEMFYLFFPLTCVLLLRRRWGFPVFLAALTAFVAMGPFARTVWSSNPVWLEKSYLGGMDCIALGCLCALVTDRLAKRGVAHRMGGRLLAVQALGAALVLADAVCWWLPWPWLHPALRLLGRSEADSTLLALGTCLVMLASVLCGHAGCRFTGPLRWYGRHSYEIYLTHEFAVIAGCLLYLRVHRGPVALWILGILLAAAGLGALLARYVSEPLNRRLRGAPVPTESWKT